MAEKYEILEDVVRHSFASVVWSHKIQEKQADIYARRYKLMETVNIVVASVTSVGIVTLIFHDLFLLKLASALLSIATLFITIYLKSFDLQKLSIAHKSAANKLISIRDRYMVLLSAIELNSDTVESLFSEYRELVDETDSLYSEVPSTTDKAVKMAGRALKIKKDNTFSEEEIDSFLPKSLRRAGNE